MFFMNPKINTESVPDLFNNLENIIKQIPETERYNLHYTVCECHDESKPRVFKRQNIIPFDIDDMDVDRYEHYLAPVLAAIGNLNPSDVGIVISGRGLHFLVGTIDYIDRPEYFKETKEHYKLICDRINRRLKQLKLPGKTDSAIWSAGHTMRLPGTENRKTPKEGYKDLNFVGECKLVQRTINPLPVTIKSLAGGEEFPEDEGYVKVKSKFLGGRYLPDTEGILSECEFLKWCQNNQEQVKEPQWYAMLSVVGHLEDGRTLCHKFSEKHPSYNFDETEEKIDQAISCAGPRTCEKIDTLWDGCKTCKHYQKCTSPISIKSENYIKTKDTGFREITVKKTEAGYVEMPGKIAFEDLRKFFEQEHPYVSTEAKVVYIFDGKKWSNMPDIFLEGFAQEHVKPAPNSQQCGEFRKLVFRTNQIDTEWFNDTTFKRINLSNGVLDLRGKKPKLLPHSTDYGFMSVLDYDYDPEAECPIFDRFMDDVTLGRTDLRDVLMEFAGYAFSNETCIYAKALILLGEGSNGKSTFLNVLKKLAGKDAFSSLSAKDLDNEQQRAQLQGKLFNLAEETPTRAFVDSSIFKNIVSGGSIPVKMLYKDPFSIEPRAKLMMAANELPRSADTSKGFLRRLLIVPFDAEFSDERKNKDLLIEDKLFTELPGVLNKVLEGYQRLKNQKHFTDSQTVKEAIYEYRDSIDPISGFVRECLVIKEKQDEGTEFNRIYGEYRAYLEEQGIRQTLDSPRFSKQLSKFVVDYKERRKRKGKNRKVHLGGVYLIAQESDF